MLLRKPPPLLKIGTQQGGAFLITGAFLAAITLMYGFYVNICILRDVFCIAKLSENIQINPKMSASGEINFHRRRAFDRLKFSAIIAESFIIAKVGS